MIVFMANVNKMIPVVTKFNNTAVVSQVQKLLSRRLQKNINSDWLAAFSGDLEETHGLSPASLRTRIGDQNILNK